MFQETWDILSSIKREYPNTRHLKKLKLLKGKRSLRVLQKELHFHCKFCLMGLKKALRMFMFHRSHRPLLTHTHRDRERSSILITLVVANFKLSNLSLNNLSLMMFLQTLAICKKSIFLCNKNNLLLVFHAILSSLLYTLLSKAHSASSIDEKWHSRTTNSASKVILLTLNL